jgi:alpha-1,3-fucosyltransferase
MVIVLGLNQMENPPQYRPPKQRWIFLWQESPSYNSISMGSFKNIFNLTATYEIDSDFPGYYADQSPMYWEKNTEFDVNRDFAIEKTDLVAAVISNAQQHVTSERIAYISELSSYIKVDVFGAQGKPCPVEFKDKRRTTILNNHPHDGLCKEIIYVEYKFYLAFENSICRDYITEKFFLVLRHPIIPIVLGGGPYEYYVTEF